MSERPLVDVFADRVPGGHWGLTAPAVPGAVSLVSRLSQAERFMREAIAFVSQTPADSFGIKLHVKVNSEFDKELAETRALANHADLMQREAAERTRALVGQLRKAGMSGAEIGIVLEVSPQRVSQLSST
jgi:hypothetical protein